MVIAKLGDEPLIKNIILDYKSINQVRTAGSSTKEINATQESNGANSIKNGGFIYQNQHI